MAVLGLVLIWVAVILMGILMKKWHMMKLAYKIPGPKGYPIIGNALTFWGKPSQVFWKLAALSSEFKRLMGIWLGHKLVVVMYDPRDAEVVFRATKVMEKADEYRFLRPWLGDSILLSTGSKFRKNKKIIMPTFHANILKQYVDVFYEGAHKLVLNVQKEVGKEEFDIQNYFYNNMLSTLLGEDMITFLETTMGVSHETFGTDSIINYGVAVSELCKIAHIRSYKVWLWFESIFNRSKYKKIQDDALKAVHPMTEEVIQKRKQDIQTRQEQNFETGENTKKRSVLLDLLLESSNTGPGLSDQEIKDEVLTMMFAGQDTTSVSMGFVLSLLGIKPTIQAMAYAEIEEIFGSSDRPATYDDLQRMEFLERVIQETWRLYPPIPLVARQPTQDVKLETCTLPAGCTIAVIIMLLHRNPEYYPNPHKFNPDNFLPERIKARHPYAFVPFSAGFRTCVGSKYAMLNIKVVLSTILRNYKVTSKRKEADWTLVGQTTLKRREGFLLAFHPRENAPHLTISTCDKKTTEDEISLTKRVGKDTNKDINGNECVDNNKTNGLLA